MGKNVRGEHGEDYYETLSFGRGMATALMAHSSCCYLLRSAQDQAINTSGRGACAAHPFLRSYWQTVTAGGKGNCLQWGSHW